MSIFSIQKFSQNIPNFDTLERAWQSLFKVYNQTLRQMGDNDFSVEHAGVRVRQMRGRWKEWQNTMRWPSKRLGTFWRPATTRTFFFFFFFFVELFSLEREQNMAFWGATVFFPAVGPCRVMSLEKNEKKFHLKKRQRFRKNHRRGHRTRARARINITPQTYGTEEVWSH